MICILDKPRMNTTWPVDSQALIRKAISRQKTAGRWQLTADSPATRPVDELRSSRSGQAGSLKFRNPQFYSMLHAPCFSKSAIRNPQLLKCLVPLPIGDCRDLHRLWK
jgi:hypothetical protein